MLWISEIDWLSDCFIDWDVAVLVERLLVIKTGQFKFNSHNNHSSHPFPILPLLFLFFSSSSSFSYSFSSCVSPLPRPFYPPSPPHLLLLIFRFLLLLLLVLLLIVLLLLPLLLLRLHLVLHFDWASSLVHLNDDVSGGYESRDPKQVVFKSDVCTSLGCCLAPLFPHRGGLLVDIIGLQWLSEKLLFFYRLG